MTKNTDHLTGNKHAQKGEEKASSFLYIRCTPANKSAWVNAAKPGKLSAWVTRVLNKEAENVPE